jgi:ubiquinone/menaquinone biosynthesis C-methylase UbiE
MRTALLCCAVLTHALRLELDVDGKRLHLEYEESNLWEARFRYAEAFVAKHDLARYNGLGCEEVLYARHKCVASKIEEAMKAHRDQVRAIMRQWVSTVKETVSVNAQGEEDTTWLQFLQRRMFRGCALDSVADPPSNVLSEFVALEVGCGSGKLMRRLANRVRRLDGADTSKTALSKAHERLSGEYTLYHSDGLLIDAVPNATYDIVYSANLLQRIPIHALRYKYLEEFFRVLKCDGHLSLQMGFGEGGAGYYDDHLTTSTEVSVTNATHLLQDLYKVGFRDHTHEVVAQSPPSSLFSQSLLVVGRKQCPMLGITVIIDGVEQPKIEAGGSRQYVDPVVHDVAPSPDGIRRRKRAAENCGGEAEIDEDEVDAEIADLQRQLAEAKRRKKRKKGPPKKRKPLHPQFVEDNLVGLDGKTCPSCVN